jgi:selenocysteine-specific elongation factor
VVKDPTIEPAYLADGRLTLLDDAPGQVPRVFRARVDHGTAEVLVKIVLADLETLGPGEACYAQFRFEEQVLLYPGDQFIVRSLTPVTTIGGGQVIDPAAHKHGTGPRWRDRLALLEQGAPDAIATLLLEEAFPSFLLRGRLEASPYLWRFGRAEIAAAVGGLVADGRAVTPGVAADAAASASGAAQGASPDTARRAAPEPPGIAAGSSEATVGSPAAAARLYHGRSFRALVATTLSTLARRAESDALNPYLTLGQLRRELAGGKEWPALDAALEQLQSTGEITRTEHGFRMAGGAGANELADERTARLLGQFGELAGVTGVAGEEPAPLSAETPTVAVAAEGAGMKMREAQRLVDALVRQNRLIKVGEDLYYPPDRLDALMTRLATAMEAAGQLTLAEARDLLGTSRRYAQALLEHMDSEGMTLRVGDARRLRRRRR